jgi:hypothetical protein
MWMAALMTSLPKFEWPCLGRDLDRAAKRPAAAKSSPIDMSASDLQLIWSRPSEHARAPDFASLGAGLSVCFVYSASANAAISR